MPITSITNGVHTPTWMARRMRVLFDKYLGDDWLEHLDEPATWEKMEKIPSDALWAVRMHLKRKLAFYTLDRARQRWMKGDYHPSRRLPPVPCSTRTC